MNISDNGLKLIAKFEGLRLEAYTATASERERGIWTIGYGSTHWPDGRPVKKGDRLANEAEALTLLKDTVKPYVAAVNRAVKVHVTQNQFDAMVSICYNIGTSAFEKSTLVRKLNKIDIIPVANEFSRWTKQAGVELAGLKNRRHEERNFFLS